MEKKYAKVALALIAICCIGVSYAENGVQPGFNLNNWEFKLGANYLQFSNNGSNFAFNDTTDKLYNISPSYQFGYTLGLGYHTPKGTDINLDYTHLNTSNSNTVQGDNLFITSDIIAGPFTWVKGTQKFTYDSVDLTGGHRLNVLPTLNLNYYGGLNYTHLKKDMRLIGTTPGTRVVNEFGTSFDGFGPTFGLDAECSPFDSMPNLTVVGGLQGTALYGRMSGYSRFDDNGLFNRDSIPSERTVVPGVGSKIGLNYGLTYPNMRLDAQLGYQLNEYFGVTKDNDYTNTSSNASFQGFSFIVRGTF